jgi:hypothetical protein
MNRNDGPPEASWRLSPKLECVQWPELGAWYASDDRRHCFVIEYGGHRIDTTRLNASGLALKTIAEGADQKVITQAYCKAHERLDNPPWPYIVHDLNPPRDESEGQGLRLRSPGSSI